MAVESSVSAGGKALRSPDCLAERRRISIRDRMTALPSKVKSLLFNTFVVRLSLACRRRSGGCVGGHFWDTRHRWPGLGLLAPLAFPLPAGGAPADASVSIFGIRGIVGRGWDCSRRSPFPCLPAALRRMRRWAFLGCAASSAGAGIASRRSPFLCLPAALRRMRRWAFLGYAASLAGAGIARAARLSLACRRRSGGCVGGHFGDTRHRWPGLELARAARFPLPAGGVPARTGKYRTAVFLLCGATSSKLSCPA